MKIGFTSNPNDDFQLDVFYDCTANHYAECPECHPAQPYLPQIPPDSAPSSIHQTRPTDQWDFSAAGENPCWNSGYTLTTGMQLCQNHTRMLYIRVTRRTAANCSTFILQATNGL